MPFSATQRIQRFNQERKATEDLKKVIRRAIKKWKRANKGPVGKKVAAKLYKFNKIIL